MVAMFRVLHLISNSNHHTSRCLCVWSLKQSMHVSVDIGTYGCTRHSVLSFATCTNRCAAIDLFIALVGVKKAKLIKRLSIGFADCV